MEARNCRRCGTIFNFQDSPYCGDCRALDDEDFKRVKEYLYDNPKASMMQLSKDTNVSSERIKRYLKDGRLEIIGATGNTILFCESCHKSVTSGRYCDECARNISKGLKSAANSLAPKEPEEKKPSAPSSGGFKFLNKDKK